MKYEPLAYWIGCMLVSAFVIEPALIRVAFEIVAMGSVAFVLGLVVWVIAKESDATKKQAEREGRQ